MTRADRATARAIEVSRLGELVPARVIAIFDQADEIRTFRIERPAGFDFRAGQYLTVEIEAAGRRLTRHYSISSAPETAEYLEISIKREGLASRTLHSTIGVDSFLSVRRPAGGFVYPDGDERPLVLIGGGVGFAPLMSMLRHAAVSDPSRPVTLLLSVRSEKDILFRRDLHLLSRQNPHVRVGVTLTRGGPRKGFLSGHIDEALLRRATADPAKALFYICGPAAMAGDMKGLLERLGVPSNQIRWEAFETMAPAALMAPAEVQPEPAAPEAAPRLLHFPTKRDPDETVVFSRKDQAKEILRFAKGEMALHWSIALPFLTCFVTGMVVKFFYNLHSDGISRDVLTFVHKVAGGCLTVFPTLAILRNWRDYKVHIENVKVGFSWTIDDLKWLFLIGPSTVSKKVVLPEQRKFNAAERLNFMMVMLTYPLFIVTGILLWIPGNHFAPWLIHVSAGLVAPLLMLGHIYMAVVNPDTRVGLTGMLSGRVDREWAKHHYALWYKERFEDDGTPKRREAD